MNIYDILLGGIAVWALVIWSASFIRDFVKYRTRGTCLVEFNEGFNSYHFLGIMYLVILIVIRKTYAHYLVKMIITISFMIAALISSYRAVRKQGLFENGLCIPEQNCDLSAIKYYKWSSLIEVEGCLPLYLKVIYKNMLTSYGIKVIKMQVPIQKKETVQCLLAQIEGCKEA